jgi:hypothetical protein
LVAVTTSPGTTAPVLSVTVPVTAPLPESCAIAVPAHIRAISTAIHPSHETLLTNLWAMPCAFFFSLQNVILLIIELPPRITSKNSPTDPVRLLKKLSWRRIDCGLTTF